MARGGRRLKVLLGGALLVSCVAWADAETHRFKPTSYSREFTAHVEPVLRVRPGDTVETTCVDSNGDDEDGKRVTLPYNPLTGPFFVEGAEPGDTLVVVLERVRLNRKTGVGSTRISDAVVEPAYVRKNLPVRSVTWTLDPVQMIGTTDFSERMKQFRLPLRPFPGCVGVAPPRRDAPYSLLMARTASATSSITSDANGGNVDYNRLVEGATLYFPVSATGAFFFIGDGHAAQGDGEMSGGAIETSLAVRLRFSLVKGKGIPAMRAESSEEYMALGMGKPLDDALQQANVNMLDWLTTGMGFSAEEAHVLLGTSARYDIVAIGSPRSVVACRLAKDGVTR